MASTNYEIDDDLYMRAKGRFTKGVNIAKGEDIRSLVTALVGLYNSINEQYAASVSNDGKIIGIERSYLIEKTDHMIQLIILCMKYFLEGREINLTSDSDIDPPLTLVFEHDEWFLNGVLPRSISSYNGTLARFYQESLLPELKSFFGKFKSASADNNLKPSEKKDIVFHLRDILLGTIKMYHLLYHLKINA